MSKDKKRPNLPQDKASKEVRFPAQSQTNTRPLWAFRSLDLQGPWCWAQMATTTLLEVMERLKNFENMTWVEIEQRSGSHFVDRDSLIKAANDRLAEIRQDDVDSLFSLRINGKARIWGIRDEHILRVLWWDPEHQVCPSLKKNT